MTEPSFTTDSSVADSAIKRFDVFLSHNSKDRHTVERIAEKLKRAGLEPWLDTWCLTPGGDSPEELAAGLQASLACAVFIGSHGVGDWEDLEYKSVLSRAVKDRAFRLFPVLLPGLPEPFDPNTLPPFLSVRTWVDLRKGYEDTRAFQSLINAIKGVPLGPERAIEPRNDICPYRGLQTFDEAHAEFFFGRDGDIQRLVEKLKGTRFLAVLGPSGSGKSSLVRAGLIPALRRGQLPGSDSWLMQIFTPTAHPLQALAVSLANLGSPTAMSKMADEMKSDERELHLYAMRVLSGRPAAERIVFVVDQFEEVFTLCRDDHERAQFLANLLYAGFVPDGRCVVLLTMRADFYQKCAAYPELSARLAEQQFLVSPMDSDGLRQAIEEPAWRVGLEFESGLVATILNDLENQPGALPLLEHALLELWERRRGGMLTLEGYRESGGVEGAIAKRADTIFTSFTPEQQAIVRRVMLRLTQPGEGSEDTRRRAALGELITQPSESDEVEAVVRQMADARLLMTAGDDQTGERLVDVSHEALIRGWPLLREWIDKDRSGLRTHRRLTEAALRWQQLERDQGSLYRSAQLAQAIEWRASNEAALNELEREFLDASLALKKSEEEQREEQQRRELEAAQKLAATETAARKRQRVLLLGVLVAFVAALIAWQVAKKNEAHSRQLVSSANVKLISQYYKENAFERASEILNSGLSDDETRGFAWHYLWHLNHNELRTLKGHSAAVVGIAYSPNGKVLATVGWDDKVKLWNTETWEEVATINVVLESQGWDGLVQVEYSPSGEMLAARSLWGEVKVWETRTLKEVRTFKIGTSSMNLLLWAAFSLDGKSWITRHSNAGYELWDLTLNPTQKKFLQPEEITALQLKDARPVLSSDGMIEALGGKTVTLWDRNARKELYALQAQGSYFHPLAFSRDSKRLIASSSNEIIVWNLDNRELSSTYLPKGHSGRINNRAVSPEGDRLATASDAAIKIWDLTKPQEPIPLTVELGNAACATISSDGTLLALGSFGGTVRLWDLNALQEIGVINLSIDAQGLSLESARQINEDSADDVEQVAFSLDGSILAIVQSVQTTLWDVKRRAMIAHLPGHIGGGNGDVQRHSPDRNLLAYSLGSDPKAARTTKLRNLNTRQEIVLLETNIATSIAFSPDGRTIALTPAGMDGKVMLWDVVSQKFTADLKVPGYLLYSIGFLNDRKTIVAAGEFNQDIKIAFWDLATKKMLTNIQWNGDATLASSSALALTAKPAGLGNNNNLDLFDKGIVSWVKSFAPFTSTPDPIFNLKGHTGSIESVAFANDGQTVATGSQDKLVKLWNALTGQEMLTLGGHSSSVTFLGFTPNNRMLISMSKGEVKFWLAATRDEVTVQSGQGPGGKL